MASDDACRHCKRAEQAYNKSRTEPYLFTLHFNVELIKGSVKNNEDKKSKLKEIEKKVSALRNTKGGDLLIHLYKQDETDRYLGHLDDSIDAILKNLIPDGKLFTDIYTRRWLCDDEGFSEYKNIVVLTVEQSDFITTVDYKTKIPSDFKIENPSTINIVSLLSKPTQSISEPAIRGIHNHTERLHENRNIELKFLPPNSCEETPSTFVAYIWNRLRFREHLCSMSKLQKGGSFFVGIREETTNQKKYESKHLILAGFTRRWSPSEFEECLMTKVLEEASFQASDGRLTPLPSNLVTFEFHEIQTGSYILEIAVGFANGIVFYHNKGPETYTIDSNGKIDRMEHGEWLRRMKLFSVSQPQ